jgi:hypothetical protein
MLAEGHRLMVMLYRSLELGHDTMLLPVWAPETLLHYYVAAAAVLLAAVLYERILCVLGPVTSATLFAWYVLLRIKQLYVALAAVEHAIHSQSALCKQRSCSKVS